MIKSFSNSDQNLPIVTEAILAPLRPLGVMDGHQVLQVNEEIAFSNDNLITPLQPYPGAQNPELNTRKLFPIPDKVGEYCSKEEFLKKSKYMAQWVHWRKRSEMILDGRYHELAPAHFEGIFTLVCNFVCPHCTRRVTRTKWVEGGTWELNSEVERKNTMHPDGLKHALDEAASMMLDDQMGIVWGGGDPTANPFTYDAMLYSKRLGITSSFLTNGVFLEVDRVLEAEPILVRISLNCGTEEAYRRFHGYPKGWDYFERVKKKMRELARRKLETKSRTLIGISLIGDERNITDLIAAAEEVRAVVEESGPGIDYVIVRPVMQYAHFDKKRAQLNTNTKSKLWELVEEGGIIWKIFDNLKIPLIPIKDSFSPPPPDEFYGQDTQCFAYGICSEIRHNGDVQLCSDSYGNPEYTIGNLFENSLSEIWKSEKRKEVLRKINEKECYKNTCPHNSRGHHHNRIFHQIEKMRQEGKMDIVRRWAEDLRQTTLPLGHSFFI